MIKSMYIVEKSLLNIENYDLHIPWLLQLGKTKVRFNIIEYENSLKSENNYVY